MPRFILFFFITFFTTNFVFAQRALIPVDSAIFYFNQLKEIGRSEKGKMWGKPLWGPTLIVNRETRRLIASHPDGDGLFTERDKVYLGAFPDELPINSKPVQIGGKTWAVLVVPFPKDKEEKDKMFLMELFKRYQDEEGFYVGNYNNNHLENKDARIYLKLEWLALENAMKRSGEEGVQSIKDALIFRNVRRSLYGQNIADERRFEIHEGLGEYTALKLTTQTPEEMKQKLFYSRAYYWKTPSFVSSFAYHSGAMYAYLLDEKLDESWKTTLKNTDDLGILLQKAYNITMPASLKAEAEKSKAKYMYEKVEEEEMKREGRWQAKQESCKTTFTQGTVIEMDLSNFNVGCNPKMEERVEPLGTFYPTAKIVDSWGVLDVNRGGVIITPDQKKVLIPVEKINNEGNKVVGEGWILQINESWELFKEGNNYKIKQKEQTENNG